MNFDLSTWRDPEWEHFRKVLQQAIDRQVPAPIRLPLKVMWVRQQTPVSDDMRFMAEAEVEGAEWQKRRYKGYAKITLQQCLSYKSHPADILFIVVDQLAASLLDAAYRGLIGLSLGDTISAYQTEYDRRYQALMQASVSQLAIPAGVAGASEMQVAESARMVDQGMADFDRLILPQLITNAVRPPSKGWFSQSPRASESVPPCQQTQPTPPACTASPRQALLSPEKARQVQELVDHGLIEPKVAMELLGAPMLPQEIEEKCSEFEQVQKERRRKAFWKD